MTGAEFSSFNVYFVSASVEPMKPYSRTGSSRLKDVIGWLHDEKLLSN